MHHHRAAARGWWSGWQRGGCSRFFGSEGSSGTRGLCLCRPASATGTPCVVSWEMSLFAKMLLFGVEGNPVTWCLLEGEIKAHFHRGRSKVGCCLPSHFLDFLWHRGCTGPQRNLPEMPAFQISVRGGFTSFRPGCPAELRVQV
ncbi:hypothetical protein HJG60_009209 [Phyllostomus discolor]|uniref:Uncharacterized protein n=1 Tax=Phyllostomus discolor TaxID=89673 RepID=A0A833YS60_9CHIR|nr:hypothetical protein HJG60_009209 [Phyllostomus discolor]